MKAARAQNLGIGRERGTGDFVNSLVLAEGIGEHSTANPRLFLLRLRIPLEKRTLETIIYTGSRQLSLVLWFPLLEPRNTSRMRVYRRTAKDTQESY